MLDLSIRTLLKWSRIFPEFRESYEWLKYKFCLAGYIPVFPRRGYRVGLHSHGTARHFSPSHPIGGSRGCEGRVPSSLAQSFFIFMQNNRLAPPGKSWICHCMYHWILKNFKHIFHYKKDLVVTLQGTLTMTPCLSSSCFLADHSKLDDQSGRDWGR